MTERNSNSTPERVHSEKVDRLLNARPPFFARWGTLIVAVLCVIAAIVLSQIHWPYADGTTALGKMLGF